MRIKLPDYPNAILMECPEIAMDFKSGEMCIYFAENSDHPDNEVFVQCIFEYCKLIFDSDATDIKFIGIKANKARFQVGERFIRHWIHNWVKFRNYQAEK